jgi:hypothetical protein
MNRITYATNIINAVCVLYGNANQSEKKALLKIAKKMLNKVWAVERKSYGNSNVVQQAKIFWDHICVSAIHVYAISIIYNELINKYNDAKNVEITIQPKNIAEQFRLHIKG